MAKLNKIRFIGAHQGGLQLDSDPGVKVGYSKDPNELAKLIKTHGLADDCYFTSCMDFADEYGFDHYDGAKILWEKALNVILNTELTKRVA